MRPRTSCLVARVGLAAALLGLAAWRVACIGAGPDVDTDAYAHHMIARAILADPHDLGVHWVWLPLFHYLQVPLVAAGGTMNLVRYVNVVLTAALPIVLFGFVRRTVEACTRLTGRTRPPLPASAVALLAALFAAASPIAMQMGTTAQPEPLFALVMLGVAIAFEARRYAGAAALLGAGVLLRYEAWAALAVVAATLSFELFAARPADPARPSDGDGDGDGDGAARNAREKSIDALRRGSVVALPVALIVAWAALRRPADGRWFGFLGQTREFATSATHESTALDRGVVGLLHDLVYYPVLVPARVMGPAVFLVPFGIVRTCRQQGVRFVVVLAGCLGFVSLTWVMRSSLGLDRHFVVVIALYATFAAQGIAAIAEAVEALARRLASDDRAHRAARAAGAVLSITSLALLAASLDTWMEQWKASIARGWPDRAAAGAYLRTLPPTAKIFCDEATVEILSGLDRERFDRHWMDDAHTWDLVAQTARTEGSAYVATWSRKLVGHDRAGAVVFQTGETGPAPGFTVLRVAQDAGRAWR